MVRGTPPAELRSDQDSVASLVRAAAGGDSGAWAELVRRFGGLVWGIARSYRLNEADVADVSQVVWLRLADHLDGLREPDHVAGWLATTTNRECLRVLRHSARVKPMSDTDVLDRADAGAEPLAAMAGRERAIALRNLIQTLPDHQQRLIELLLRDPRPSYKEIAAELSIPVGSVGPTRQRCLAALRIRCIAAGLVPTPA